LVRQVFFFQMLRPSDGLVDVPARIANLSATYANALTPLFAALGFAAASFLFWRRSSDSDGQGDATSGPWRVVALWTFFSLLLFTYSRSFYAHYYIQLAAPLCLLGSGVSFIPRLLRGPAGGSVRRGALAGGVGVALLMVVALPVVVVQWNGVTRRIEDRIFEIVGRYISDAVPPGTPVLTTDEQFNFLAARPPSRSQTGYLVDSYGHLIYLGMGLDSRALGDLLGAVAGGRHGGNNPDPIIQSAPSQTDLLQRALSTPLVVIHDKGRRRFTAATMAQIEGRGEIREEENRYTIYGITEPLLTGARP
jgi:hypothetical protein